jgi:hypothetical protein
LRLTGLDPDTDLNSGSPNFLDPCGSEDTPLTITSGKERGGKCKRKAEDKVMLNTGMTISTAFHPSINFEKP